MADKKENFNDITLKPNDPAGNSWDNIAGKPKGDRPNIIDENGEVKVVNASTIRGGRITGTTIQTAEQGARVVLGGNGDESNDITMFDDSTGGTTPITGNTASINFKRTDDSTQNFKIQKRAGINDDDENVMEMFYDKVANGSGLNYMFLGNTGDGANTDIKTDIIQNEVTSLFTTLTKNSLGTPEIYVATTDYFSLDAGGSSVVLSPQRSGSNTEGSVQVNVVASDGLSAITPLIIDNTGIILRSLAGNASGVLGVNDSNGALTWNGTDIT